MKLALAMKTLQAVALLLATGLAVAQETPPTTKIGGNEPSLEIAADKHIELLKITTVRNGKQAELSGARAMVESIPRLERELAIATQQLQRWLRTNSPCEGGIPNFMTGKWVCPEVATTGAGMAPPSQ